MASARRGILHGEGQGEGRAEEAGEAGVHRAHGRVRRHPVRDVHRAVVRMGEEGPGPAGGRVRIREIPAMNVAALSFKGQPSEYRNAYRELSAWVSQHGYEWAGPSIEAYTKKPERVRGKTVMYAQI